MIDAISVIEYNHSKCRCGFSVSGKSNVRGEAGSAFTFGSLERLEFMKRAKWIFPAAVPVPVLLLDLQEGDAPPALSNRVGAFPETLFGNWRLRANVPGLGGVASAGICLLRELWTAGYALGAFAARAGKRLERKLRKRRCTSKNNTAG